MSCKHLILLAIFIANALHAPSQVSTNTGAQSSMPGISSDGNSGLTVQGNIAAQSINSVVNAASFSDPDWGDKINHAVKALPASGGEIYVPTMSSCIQYSTPIVLSGKAILLKGAGPASCLEYTGTGTAITFRSIGSKAYVASSFGAGMQDITIQGPSTPTSSTTSVGLNLDNVAGFVAHRVQIFQLGTGITFGNNTYIVDFHDSSIRANYVAMNYPAGLSNSGENMTFQHVTFSNGAASDGVSAGVNCVMLNSPSWTETSEWNFTDDSFDTCQVVLGSDKAMQVRFVNPHFEDGQSSLDYPFVKMTADANGNIAQLINPEFFVDAAKVTADAFVELNGYSKANVVNPCAFVYGGTSTPGAWFRTQGSGTATLTFTNPAGFASNFRGSIPTWSTDGTNGAAVYQVPASNTASEPVTSDGYVVLATANSLTGDYVITWPNASNRFQSMIVQVGATDYATSSALNVLENYAYAGNDVISNLRIVLSNNVPQLIATIGNRNGTTGPITVQWIGDGVYAPRLLPAVTAGTKEVTTNGFSEDSGGNISVTGNVSAGNGSNVVYRCTTAGTLPAGALTISASTCGASTDSGLRVK
jgi:hypothetical protein